MRHRVSKSASEALTAAAAEDDDDDDDDDDEEEAAEGRAGAAAASDGGIMVAEAAPPPAELGAGASSGAGRSKPVRAKRLYKLTYARRLARWRFTSAHLSRNPPGREAAPADKGGDDDDDDGDDDDDNVD